ncbi:MAG: sigma 54-interacting transcriptional regulator [Acidobacteria bacterium]|nr:sigma 54-interacting transcriptional regulator [Acidobacteriota bacterium]
MHVSEMVAVAAEAAVARQKEHDYVERLSSIRERCRLLMDVNKLLFSELDPQALFAAISDSVHRLLKHDFAFLVLLEPGTNRFHIQAMSPEPPSSFFPTGLTFAAERSASKFVLDTGKALLLDGEELRGAPFDVPRSLYDQGIRSLLYVPLLIGGRGLGTLVVASLQPGAFSEDDVELLSQVGDQAAIALQNAFAFGQVSELIEKLEDEKTCLESELGSSYTPEEIVGRSEALAVVLEQVRTVAPTDATVVVLGETGTGKELITRAIHRLSERNRGPFVKLNCSAIPTGLLESELFGHEKGAFTGAIQQKVGRLELADKGTLFLDEVGDIPLDLQPKLLRVLQDQEFERLGSNRTLRVNVRIIAATNRNLEKMVEAGTFRRDLFYRLNVFPIHVPPLRERKQDIPLLVRHFVGKFATRMNRRVGGIPPATMQALQDSSWPGNVRELENLIERAVILSPGKTLNVPLSELKSSGAEPAVPAATTLADADRAHIMRILRETKGVISGPAGAAARLGMKRTTLNYKMKKLGIDPRSL